MALLSFQDLAFIFGLLGNIVSFMAFLAPVPTFYNIYKRKSSEGFQPIPYVVALFSAGLLLYYAYLKKNAFLIVTINGFGCVIELAYLFFFLFYAPKKSKIFTVWLMMLDVGALGMVIVFSYIFAKGSKRVTIVGWICAVVNVAVFAAPLSIMRKVIRTKSVEFMPFTLSACLTLCATMWFGYGFFMKDFYIALPNVLGVLFGAFQMILYFIYKDTKEKDNKELELQVPEKSKEGVEIRIETINGDLEKKLDSTVKYVPECWYQSKQENDRQTTSV